MGFIGYDIGARALAASPEIKLADQPCAFLAHYDVYLKPSATQGWELHTESLTSEAIKKTIVSYLHRFEEGLLDLLQHSVSPPALPLTALWSADQYAQAFHQTQQYLYQGDSYQINLTQKWQGKLATLKNPILSQDNFNPNPNLVDYLPALHQNTQAPFSGYLALTHSPSDLEFELLCSQKLLCCLIKQRPLIHHNLANNRLLLSRLKELYREGPPKNKMNSLSISWPKVKRTKLKM